MEQLKMLIRYQYSSVIKPRNVELKTKAFEYGHLIKPQSFS